MEVELGINFKIYKKFESTFTPERVLAINIDDEFDFGYIVMQNSLHVSNMSQKLGEVLL